MYSIVKELYNHLHPSRSHPRISSERLPETYKTYKQADVARLKLMEEYPDYDFFIDKAA